jgi:signal transduction histidine kinase
VSKIIDEHRGSIRIDNASGPGACFVIFFPTEASTAEAKGALATK